MPPHRGGIDDAVSTLRPNGPARAAGRVDCVPRDFCVELLKAWGQGMKANTVIRIACALAFAGALHLSAANAATERELYDFKGPKSGGDTSNRLQASSMSTAYFTGPRFSAVHVTPAWCFR